MPSEILVEQAKAGDRNAFERLFEETHVQIFNFLLSLGIPVHEAEDLCQETFVRAWGALPKLKKTGIFVAWLHKIARNLARDWIRKNARVGSFEFLDAASSRPMDNASDPAYQAEAKVLEATLRKSLMELPEQQRTPLVMHHVEGMEVREISTALGIPFGTALSRLARARASLAKKLSPYINVDSKSEKKSDVLSNKH